MTISKIWHQNEWLVDVATKFFSEGEKNKWFLLFTEVYRRPPGGAGGPGGDFSIYTSLYDPDRSKSANPNVYFYKTAGYPTGFIY